MDHLESVDVDITAPVIGDGRFTYWPFWQEEGHVVYVSEQETPCGADVQTYHSRTRLKTSQLGATDGLLVDCGALGNLSGDAQIYRIAQRAMDMAGLETKYAPMPNALTVEGVGQGSQTCVQMACVPIAHSTGEQGTYQAPIIPNSNVPSLLGLATMEKQKVILDLHGMKYIIPGKGKTIITLPPGSNVLPMEKAESGHLLLPIDCWIKAQESATASEIYERQQNATTWHISTPGNSSASTEYRTE